MTGTFPDAWEEACIISVLIGDAGVTGVKHFAAITSDVKIDEPDYPGESIPNTAGGRIWNQKPQEDGEVTFEIYPIGTEVSDNTSMEQFFHGRSGNPPLFDTDQPANTGKTYYAGISKQRDTYCVAVLWTDDATVTSALAAVSTADKVAQRWYCKLARVTSYKSSFNPTDGLKATVTFKFPPINKAGTTKPFGWGSTNGTATLAALTYTGPTDL